MSMCAKIYDRTVLETCWGPKVNGKRICKELRKEMSRRIQVPHYVMSLYHVERSLRSSGCWLAASCTPGATSGPLNHLHLSLRYPPIFSGIIHPPRYQSCAPGAHVIIPVTTHAPFDEYLSRVRSRSARLTTAGELLGRRYLLVREPTLEKTSSD
ncbi:hypothetical protein J6590_034576 [Homalodisca vitripennis]|nr:hypothetical protein J6590_034576 [Homalodisca vitripennis]